MKDVDNSSVVIHLTSSAVHTVVALRSLCGTKAQLVAISSVQTDSFGSGRVLHRDKLVVAIKKSIKEVEEQSGVRIASACLCFASAEMITGNVCNSINLDPSQKIANTHMSQALSRAKEEFLSNDYYLSQFSAQLIWLDDREIPIKDALNLDGVSQLSVSYHLMALPVTSLNDIYKAVQTVVPVHNTVFDVVAGAQYALMDNERSSGVLFVDIGAHNTSACIYIKNILIFSTTIATGGRGLTDEIAREFHLDTILAEKIKCKYGSLQREQHYKSEFLFPDDKDRSKVVNQDILCQLIQRYYQRLFCDITTAMKKNDIPEGCCVAGIVLAGGGAQIKGLVPFLKKEYQMPIHLTNKNIALEIHHNDRLSDSQIKHLSDELNNTKLQTAFGAVLFEFDEEFRRDEAIHDPDLRPKTFVQTYKEKFLEFFKDYFQR